MVLWRLGVVAASKSAAAGVGGGYLEVITPSSVVAAAGSSATINADGSVTWSRGGLSNIQINGVFSANYNFYQMDFRPQSTATGNYPWFYVRHGSTNVTGNYPSTRVEQTSGTYFNNNFADREGIDSMVNWNGTIDTAQLFTKAYWFVTQSRLRPSYMAMTVKSGANTGGLSWWTAVNDAKNNYTGFTIIDGFDNNTAQNGLLTVYGYKETGNP